MKLFCAMVMLVGFASADYKDVCLSAHNKLRALHQHTGKMTWDDNLAAEAKSWADHLAQDKSYGHGSSGENIYYATGPAVTSCATAALSWYNEYQDYNYGKPSDSTGVVGHFTQLVWKSSVKLGVGIAHYVDASGTTHTYIVARYLPAGNYNGENAANVFPRKPGAVVPTIYQLDPSECKDAGGTELCNTYKSHSFCEPSHKYFRLMDVYCAKTCSIC